MTRLCVFCGSRDGAHPAYIQSAREVAASLASRGVGIVYGGGSRGMMGAVADAALAAGGEVIGVIPEFLVGLELAHEGVTQLHVVKSMHERKALMAELSAGFLALPGGIGTLEEICEMLTWAVLDLHPKPCGILNVEGYYDALLAYLDHATAQGFLKEKHRALLISDSDQERLLARLLVTPDEPDPGLGLKKS